MFGVVLGKKYVLLSLSMFSSGVLVLQIQQNYELSWIHEGIVGATSCADDRLV